MALASSRFTPTRVGTMLPAQRPRGTGAVHPHARGNNGHSEIKLSMLCGSPPRACGQSHQTPGTEGTHRFTPTRVGTIPAKSSGCPIPSVHPHARGDNFGNSGMPAPANGSPPRAWGQCHFGPGPEPSLRFTPTRVGTIASRRLSGPHPTVHPHARGDNDSPADPGRQAGRFTPTRVGTIRLAASSALLAPVHPHARGDN